VKQILNLSVFILLVSPVMGQSIERQVFNSFGSVAQSGGVSLTSNGGEAITKTYYGSNSILSQGFLQPERKDITLDFSESESNVSSVHVWPNPTTEGLFVSYQNISANKGKLMVYDMAGKCLVQEPICADCTQQYLPLPVLADGVYVIRVALSDQRFQDKKFIKVSQ
jgi:hypothetical protein